MCVLVVKNSHNCDSLYMYVSLHYCCHVHVVGFIQGQETMMRTERVAAAFLPSSSRARSVAFLRRCAWRGRLDCVP